jgi:DNA-3-methyladenine glycosylase II
MEGTLSGNRARARAELAASDPVMAELVDRLGEWTIGDRRRGLPKPDAYGALLRTIVGQQLSTKAARTIHERVLGLFGGRTPTPEELLAVSEEDLRGAGLSGRKVTYIRDLAAHVQDGELELDRLDELSDEEVIEEIVAVRVFSGGDLGLRRAIQVAYGLEEMPTPEEAVERAERWRPHRTLAAVYLWESLANNPVE